MRRPAAAAVPLPFYALDAGVAASAGLLLLTWGADNNNVEACPLQVACGVDAVITDHVAHVRRGLVPRATDPAAAV